MTMRPLLCTVLLGALAQAQDAERALRDGRASTVLVNAGKRALGAGFLIDAARGYVLTLHDVVAGEQDVDVAFADGLRRKVRLAASDARLHLALLEIGPMDSRKHPGLGLAPPHTDAAALLGGRIGAVGAPTDVNGTLSWSVRGDGIVARVGSSDLRQIRGLLTLEHNIAFQPVDAGGPVLDEAGLVTGINFWCGGPSSTLEGVRLYPALSVNVMRAFLSVAKIPGVEPLPAEALAPAAREAEGETADGARERPLRFGPYEGYLDAKVQKALGLRTKRLVGGLLRLVDKCATCRGLKTVLLPGVDRVACPTCNGLGREFDAHGAEKLIRELSPPAKRVSEGDSRGRAQRADEWGRALLGAQLPRRYEQERKGRLALVQGMPPHAIYPIHLVLLPHPSGKGYDWFLHEPGRDGPYAPEREFENLPPEALVERVLGGDMIRLEGGRVIRLCGLCIPDEKGSIPDAGRGVAVAAPRARLEALVAGKRVRLSADRHAAFTMDGHAIAYVEVEGADVAPLLLREGLARRHPSHMPERGPEYLKAEGEARAAGVGCWAR